MAASTGIWRTQAGTNSLTALEIQGQDDLIHRKKSLPWMKQIIDLFFLRSKFRACPQILRNQVEGIHHALRVYEQSVTYSRAAIWSSVSTVPSL